MPAPDPNRFPRRRGRLRTMRDQLLVADSKPHIGVTQGGSSRKNSGAKIAATKGLFTPPKPKKEPFYE